MDVIAIPGFIRRVGQNRGTPADGAEVHSRWAYANRLESDRGWEGMTMSDPASLSVAAEPVYLELTFARALGIWWAYFWRHMLYGGIAAFLVGVVEGLVGLGDNHLLLTLSVAPVIAAVSMCVFAIVLHKQFRRFSIRLVASQR